MIFFVSGQCTKGYAQNVESLREQNSRILSDCIHDYEDFYNFLLFLETKLHYTYDTSRLGLEKFYSVIYLFHEHVISDHGPSSAGILAAISHEYKVTVLERGREIEHVILLLEKDTTCYLLIVGYFHPQTSSIIYLKHFIKVINYKIKYPDAILLLFTDYNFDAVCSNDDHDGMN